nr:MAG TPA: hypothetical protein [Caudoviricetes sp.]
MIDSIFFFPLFLPVGLLFKRAGYTTHGHVIGS